MKLSDTEQKIFDKLALGRDVPISVLYRIVTKQWPQPGCANRQQQQRIGRYLATLRPKLKGYLIEPGVRRRTYRLVKTGD